MKFRIVGDNVLIRMGLPPNGYPVYEEDERLKKAEELITKIAENAFMPDKNERATEDNPEQNHEDKINLILRFLEELNIEIGIMKLLKDGLQDENKVLKKMVVFDNSMHEIYDMEFITKNAEDAYIKGVSHGNTWESYGVVSGRSDDELAEEIKCLLDNGSNNFKDKEEL